MNIPSTRDLLHPMLQVARERARLSEVELSRFLAFQFGAYDGGPAIAKPSDLRRFACRVRVARRALLRHGMLASGAGDELAITPQGEAYLTTGWLRTDEGAEQTGAPKPTTEAAEAPSPSEQADEPVVDLKALLDEAQFGSTDLGSGWFQVAFEAEMRTWTVNVRVSNDWFVLYTHVMRLPKEPAARVLVLDLMARLNCKVSLAKFCATPGNAVVLELEYRVEHIDAEVLGNLIRMLFRVAETEYAGLARIAVGDPVLQALDDTFKKSE